MPPKKKAAVSAPSTMKELKDTLWKAADKLRGSMDASQYKDVILGLVFLKYVSDAFDERREQIREELVADGMDDEQVADLIDDQDEYVGSGVFYVPETARWMYLSQNAKGTQEVGGVAGKTIGQIIDDAMRSLMTANASVLSGTLPILYNNVSVDQRRLGELIDLLGDTRFTGHGAKKARDVLGEVYEYFLEKFARAEGKRGGEFYTPAGVVRVLVEVLEPYNGRVYDPCCGSGGMFVQTEKFIEHHGGNPTQVAVYGQEANQRTWQMARMNLAIHGVTGDLADRWEDTFAQDKHPDLLADYVMANPPFNIKDWSRREDDKRWKYGVPPAGNANYAWIQHIISKLAERGSAGVVMANGSMSSNSGGEGDIRAQLVEADLVSCMVALPTQLFRSTGIPVCVWFFAKDKSVGPKGSIDRQGQVLFIDARNLGYMVDRAERALSDEDIAKIGHTFHAWRGMESAVGAEYADEPGFCYSATLAEIKEADYALTPGRYVGAAPIEDDGEPIEEKIERLATELFAQFDESARLQAVVREQLCRVK